MELVSHAFPPGTTEVKLAPIGDIQWSGQEDEVAMKMLAKHVTWMTKEGAYFLGMGDYVDTYSPSTRAKLTGADLYDTALKALDQDAERRITELHDRVFKGTKGRWLGLLEGHHYHQYRAGITTDQQLASKLGAPFLGTSAYVRLTFQEYKSGAVGEVKIWCHHGAGSSGTPGGAINRLFKVTSAFDADVYIMGHHHQKDGKAIEYVKAVWNGPKTPPVLLHSTKLLVVSGSFLKGYVVGRMDGLVPRGGYVEKTMLNPVQLGAPLVKIRPRWKRIGEQRIWSPDLGVEL